MLCDRICQGSECASDYEYAWFPILPGQFSSKLHEFLKMNFLFNLVTNFEQVAVSQNFVS